MEKERIVSVCSLKGGVGRSLCALSLSAALARRGLRVLLLDLDPFVHTLDLMLGLEDRRLFGASDILEGRPADKVLLRHEELPSVYLCPGSDCPRVLDREELSSLIRKIEETVKVDRIVLDLPPQAETEGFYTHLSARHLVVSTQDPAALLLAAKTAETVSLSDGQVHLLLNRFDLSDLPSYARGRMRPHEMIDLAGLPLLGIVPEEYDLSRRSQAGALWQYEKEIDRPFDNVAARLEGEERLLFDGAREGKKIRRSL